jgi:hypothetical protein
MDVSQVLNVMRSGSLPFRLSRWARLGALMLAGAMLLQSGPVRLLVQQIRPAHVHHACPRCADGVCPRTPESDCACTHSDSDESDTEGVVLKTCDGEGAEALAPVVPKWQSSTTTSAPSPRVLDTERSHLDPSLSSQRLGDEIFRPPRTAPPVRLT